MVEFFHPQVHTEFTYKQREEAIRCVETGMVAIKH
jgi:hypothetical protein